jgi:hypothetical protein
MAHANQGGEAPERSYVSSMFDDDSRYSGNLFVDTSLVTPMKSLWPVQGTRLKQFDSVLRVLPGKRDDGSWSKFRTGAGKGQYGRWIYSAWAARSIGEPAVTFFLCSDKDVQDHNYDPRQHPVYILYNSIYWAVDEGSKHVKAHWAPMVTSKSRKVIKKPGPMFLVQCLVYGRGDKVYDPPMGTDEGEKIVCFDLASDGGKCLRSMLDQRNPEATSDGEADFADHYKYGDITTFDGGKFVQIYPSTHNPNRDAQPQVTQGPRRSLSKAAVAESRGRTQKGGDGDERERIGYDVTILDEYQGWDPGIAPDLAAALEERIYPWPEIVKVPDHKTAASYLWSRMRFGGELKLDVLLHAWRDHPDWLPEKDSDVWAEWVNRRQVAPGYDPDAGEDDDAGDPAIDRRPRQRAVDRGERADDQPPPRRRAGAPPPPAEPEEPEPAAETDDEPPPRRASRTVAQQPVAADATAAAEEQPLKGRVGRSRTRPATAATISGDKAATDAATAAASFRPSAAAAAAAEDGENNGPVVDKAGGFAEPPAPSAPRRGTASPPAAEPTDGKKHPRDILAAARAKLAASKG